MRRSTPAPMDYRPTVDAVADLIRGSTLRIITAVFTSREIPKDEAALIASHVERIVRDDLEHYLSGGRPPSEKGDSLP